MQIRVVVLDHRLAVEPQLPARLGWEVLPPPAVKAAAKFSKTH